MFETMVSILKAVVVGQSDEEFRRFDEDFDAAERMSSFMDQDIDLEKLKMLNTKKEVLVKVKELRELLKRL